MALQPRKPFHPTPEQYAQLIAPLAKSRVGKNPKGFSHLEAWDVRRWLIRVFGFGSFDIETIALDLVKEIEYPPRRRKDKKGNEYGEPYTPWTVVYRAQVRLTIWDQHGGYVVLEDGACGDSANQPSLGDAHDNAAKTALSQALKRCAVNLGDCFGLGLYNGGKLDPVVQRSLVANEFGASEDRAALPADDAPVQPEPAAEPQDGEPSPAALDLRDKALTKDITLDELTELGQAADEAGHSAAAVIDATGETVTLRDLIRARWREVKAAQSTAPAAGSAAGSESTPDANEQRQLQRIHILFGQLGYAGDANRDKRLDIINNRILHRATPAESSKHLTAAEKSQVINALQDKMRERERQAVPA